VHPTHCALGLRTTHSHPLPPYPPPPCTRESSPSPPLHCVERTGLDRADPAALSTHTHPLTRCVVAEARTQHTSIVRCASLAPGDGTHPFPPFRSFVRWTTTGLSRRRAHVIAFIGVSSDRCWTQTARALKGTPTTSRGCCTNALVEHSRQHKTRQTKGRRHANVCAFDDVLSLVEKKNKSQR
jgi:hypothetical protein